METFRHTQNWIGQDRGPSPSIFGLPCGSDSKEPVCNAGDRVQPLGREDPLEKGMATHSCTLAWKVPWIGYSPRGRKRVRHD